MTKTPYNEPVPEDLIDMIPGKVRSYLEASRDEEKNYRLVDQFYKRSGIFVPFDYVGAIASYLSVGDE